MSKHFVPFSGGVAATQAGKLLAVNPSAITAIFSAWSKEYKEYQLILLLVSNRQIRIRESDAESALEDLGLGQFSGDWVLDLAKDLG